MKRDPDRLPRTVVPSRYDLLLEPDLGAGTFKGSVCICVDVAEEVDEILLNAAELEIESAAIEDSSGGRKEIDDITLDAETERARFGLSVSVQPGRRRLRVEFTGILNDKLRGFYRSTFRDNKGTERIIATTQFESTHARKAFPCFDEPDFKAVFAVTLIIPEDQFAVSNGPLVEESSLGDGRRKRAACSTC